MDIAIDYITTHMCRVDFDCDTMMLYTCQSVCQHTNLLVLFYGNNHLIWMDIAIEITSGEAVHK